MVGDRTPTLVEYVEGKRRALGLTGEQMAEYLHCSQATYSQFIRTNSRSWVLLKGLLSRFPEDRETIGEIVAADCGEEDVAS